MAATPLARTLTGHALVGSNTLFYIASVYLLSYAPESTELTRGEVLLAIAIGASFDVIAIPLVAIFADRHGKRTMMLVGSIITALATIPIFLAINTGTFIGAIIAMIIAFPIAHSTVYATSSGFISGLFKPNVRYTGASISYQVGGLISSAPAPLISVLLYTTFQSWVPVALYLIAANLLAALFVLLAKRDRPTHV
ncbi:MFS transporter [Brevibacterium aurantiacum]|uniref:MFS transporter n=1 Tax=Brevibacterium aurantiacum TaxID=273384 RepID=UPI000DF3F197|nr:MFS transporter [Brevibacterium aurantiacum]